MNTEIKIEDCVITIKESGGKYQLPFTWIIRDIDKTFFRLSEDAFNSYNECLKDAQEYFYKYLNH